MAPHDTMRMVDAEASEAMGGHHAKTGAALRSPPSRPSLSIPDGSAAATRPREACRTNRRAKGISACGPRKATRDETPVPARAKRTTAVLGETLTGRVPPVFIDAARREPAVSAA